MCCDNVGTPVHVFYPKCRCRKLVELKNGETYNGRLVNCDTWMNIHLREVICTSKDGDRFWYMPKCYVRGNTIKYLQLKPSLGRGSARGREEAEEAEEGLAEVETEVQDEDEVEADLNN